MSLKNRKISTLVETQLPGFISSEYENFSKFVEKYYEQLELQGQPLDIIHNITKYRDINFYEENLLKQYTTLTVPVENSSTTIVVDDATSFPKENGYIRINDEICFYKERTDTEFLEVSRGVSGNTTLGDLYTKSSFVNTEATSHSSGSLVYNVSNLFLYAFVKNFETEYLGGFSEKYLKGQVDKRTLIKNISKFYKAKGTDKSIKFIFNSIVSRSSNDIPEIYDPKDFTLKSSVSDWVSTYSLKVKILSGNPTDLIGGEIIQSLDNTRPEMLYASAIVDNVVYRGNIDEEDIYEIILDPASLNGKFEIASKTTLTKSINSVLSQKDRINVGSTLGMKKSGKLLIQNEVLTYNDKTVNQFIIEQRGTPPSFHPAGTKVYSFSTLEGNGVKLLALGVLYNLKAKTTAPFSQEKDLIQISQSGFDTKDPIIYDRRLNAVRWLINETNETPKSSTNPTIQNSLSQLIADVSAIYEDEQYYYVCSSGYPSHEILSASTTLIPSDAKILRLIRKRPTVTTEIYKTNNRDVGIFVDGTLAFSHKDIDYVNFGKLTKISVVKSGTGYKKPPFVLIDNKPKKARAKLAGEVVESIEIITKEAFNKIPQITITAGRNAKVNAIVTSGKVTSLVIANPGEYYSSPPIIRISDLAGRGKFAEYRAVVSPQGQIVGFDKIDEGRFYTQENIVVEVIEDAKNNEAVAEAFIETWTFDRFRKLQSISDDSYGYVFETYTSLRSTDKKYVYGRFANPRRLRVALNDNLNSAFAEPSQKIHSPIIGFAYDGNPIYGPFGYENPVDSSSAVVRLSSGYVLKTSRENGPPLGKYPLGTFIEDYKWVPTVNSGKTMLDQNNGRFCVTPDYPNGTYAYFLTIDSNNIPKFPYILGENYYSLPIDSNYNSSISQDELPSNVIRLRTEKIESNGDNVYAFIDTVNSGSISGVTVENSTDTFKVGSIVHFNDNETEGSGATAVVSSIVGKDVVSLESTQIKAIEFKTTSPVYYFKNDIILQENTNAYGELIGDVFNGNQIVLRNVVGDFNTTDTISSTINVVNLILSQNSSFSKGSEISLTDGVNPAIGTGIILETTNNQNSIKVRVFTGQFVNIFEQNANKLFLRSAELADTVGSQILNVTSLSSGININTINNNIAIVETNDVHNLTKGDKINIDVTPDDSLTETLYYVRKRYYQKVTLKNQQIKVQIDDTGVGRFDILNGGVDYQTGTYTDVELIFQNNSASRKNIGFPGASGNARATITVSDNLESGYGSVINVVITNKGKGYRKGDILTVADESLNRLISSISTQRITLFVDHAGFSRSNTTLKLFSVSGLSEGDKLQINNEVVKINTVNQFEKAVSVQRAVDGTIAADHFNAKDVILNSPEYRFTEGQRIIGTGVNDPYVLSYDKNNQELTLVYEYGVVAPRQLVRSNTFYDASNPRKLVNISNVDPAEFRLEFSKNNQLFIANPIVKIQKYYKYTFDVSHFSMGDTFLDFSASSNYNIFTEEKEVSPVSPGSPGSFVSIKLGFGPNITTNTFQNKEPVNFTNYFYFIKVSPNVNTQNSFLQVVDDPLSGEKEIIYSTENKFVYSLTDIPEYDGTGIIDYNTTSEFSIGKINTIAIRNFGENYKKIPTISGVSVAEEYKALLKVFYNPEEKNISSVSVLSGGKNYSKPKILVIDGDGNESDFDVIVNNGVVTRVIVKNKGKNYSYPPVLEIIETDVKLYAVSNNIGTPQTITIVDNGGAFHNDKTLYRSYRSHTALLLKNVEDNAFSPGETIVQTDIVNGQSVVVASARVSKNGWRPGSNVLRLENVVGVIDKNLQIQGKIKNKIATITAILYTEFDPNISTYFDNLGSYTSDKGKIGVASQKLTDSYFYQDYSYVVKSRTPIEFWRDLIKDTVHPAGFKLFGEVVVESDGSIKMPVRDEKVDKTETITFINLGTKNISVIDTTRYITETIINFENLNVEKGAGSISVDTFNTSETVSGEIVLSTEFDGQFDPFDGQIIGNTSFTLIDKKTNLPIAPYNEQQLIITLDGVLQEPGVSYTVNGSQINFASPPFGQQIVEGQVVPAQTFYCKYFKFKSDTLNAKYLKKLKSLTDQFDDRTKVFDLYYEDGTIVKTDINENLIVTLNGVVQKAKGEIDKDNEIYLPTKNSYYILRSNDNSITDKIVFSTPPIKHDEVYENSPEELKNSEKSFIFGVGSYIRLKINNEVIPFRRTGPFLIVSEIDGRVKKIDDSRYALVFIDGVLQREGESYNINGPTIIFTKPLNYYISESGEYQYQNVSIILLYGRDIDQTLTAYNFEPDTYYNRSILTVNGSNTYSQFFNWYGLKSSYEIYAYQSDRMLGKVINFIKLSETSWQLTLSSQNITYNNKLPLKFTIHAKLNHPSDLTINNVVSAEVSFETDDSNNRIYTRSGSRYLYGSEIADKAWFEQTRSYAKLHPGDLIKIDGENDYREIVSIPNKVNTKDCRDISSSVNDIYGKIKATNYNDIVRGEGLSVLAKVRDGKVVSLEWNRRELDLYFEFGILLQPSAYQYFTPPILNFIPVDGRGGGAKAEVITYNGQVIDIVLLDGGSGYTNDPQVIVSRKYDLIKQSNRKIDSVSTIKLNVEFKFEMVSSSFIDIIGAGSGIAGITTTLTFGGFSELELARKITSIVLPKSESVSFEKNKFPYEILMTAGIIRPVEFGSIVDVNKEIVSIINTPFNVVSSSTITNTHRQITKQVSTTVNSKSLQNVNDATNDIGAFLDIGLSETDEIVYIADTRRFPYSSRLLIGKEIVTYEKKLTDRFLGVVRGTFGTVATTHNAGDYLRHLPELISVVPVGPATNIITQVTVTEVHQTTTAISIISASSVENVNAVTIENSDREITNRLQKIVDNQYISVLAAGISSSIVSQAQIITESYQTTTAITVISSTSFNNITEISASLSKNADIEIFYNMGVIDYYSESILLLGEIKTRSGFVTLDDPINEVIQRSGDIVSIRNTSGSLEYITNYTLGNAGFTLKTFENNAFITTGAFSGALNIQQIDLYYPSLSIRDFEERPTSSITLSGDVFNLAIPTIQNPIVYSTTTNLNSTSIFNVTGNTSYFPNSGYLFQGSSTQYTIIQYTGKTSSSFTGCTVVRGSANIDSGNSVMPYSL